MGPLSLVVMSPATVRNLLYHEYTVSVLTSQYLAAAAAAVLDTQHQMRRRIWRSLSLA
jgi:hypothetical protein